MVVGGHSFVVAVDFHFRNNSLFWIDSRRRAVMKSTLDGLKRSIVLDHGLTNPGIDINHYYYYYIMSEKVGILHFLIYSGMTIVADLN